MRFFLLYLLKKIRYYSMSNELLNELLNTNRVILLGVVMIGIIISWQTLYLRSELSEIRLTVRKVYRKFVEFRTNIEARVTNLENKIAHVEKMLTNKGYDNNDRDNIPN